MALLFCDSFDHYATADITKKWTTFTGNGSTSNFTITAPGSVSPAPPGGGQTLFCIPNSNGGAGLVQQYGGTAATVVHGAWVMFQAFPPQTYTRILNCMDGTTEQLSIRGDGAGHLVVSRSGTTLATSTNVVTSLTWYWIEFKATIDPAAGAYELRVNGTAWIGPTTGANTRTTANSYSNGIQFLTDTTPYGMYVKGVVCLDTTGAVANTFLGPVRVQCLRPSAPGNYSQWTTNDGRNFNAVDDVLMDSDSTFNVSATANQIDSFVFTDSAVSSGTVYGLQHVISARQDAGAGRSIAPLQRTSGTDYAGTTQNLGGSYVMLKQAQSVNPATGAGYTVAEINAFEAGYKLVS